MARTFTFLKKNMTKENFESFCRKLTKEYADSNSFFSAKYFCKQYDIAKSCFEKIKEYAVVNNLVSDDTVKAIMKKSIENQKRHCKKAGETTVEKYGRLISERKKNLEKDVINELVENPSKSKNDIAKKYSIKPSDLDVILARKIIYNEVDDDIVDALEERSINNAKKGTEMLSKKLFEVLRKKREENKRKSCP